MNFIKYRIYSLFCKRDLSISFINFEVRSTAMSSQSQNTIIQYRQHAIRLHQTSVDSTFSAGEYYVAAPRQEKNQTNKKFANEIYWYSQDYRAHYSVCRTFVTESLCTLLFKNTLAKVPKKKKCMCRYLYYYIYYRMKCFVRRCWFSSAGITAIKASDYKPAVAKKNT